MTRHERRGKKHLYSEAEKRDFEKRYGKKKGDSAWGATVGKVERERAAKRKGNPRRVTFYVKRRGQKRRKVSFLT